LLATYVATTNAFQPQLITRSNFFLCKEKSSRLWFSTDNPSSATPDTIPEYVTAKALRSAILTDTDGVLISLGEKMGKETSIVVFLRHLG